MSAEFSALTLDHAGLRLKASGKAKSLTAPKLDLKAALAVGGVGLLDGEFLGDLVLESSGTKAAAAGRFVLKTGGFKDADLQPLRALVALPALPTGLAVPALKASGQADWNPERVGLTGIKVEAAWGSVEASGKVLQLQAPRPEAELEVLAKLDLPELKQADMPFLKLPAGLILPASALEAKLGIDKDDLRIERLHVKTKAGTLEAAGKILKAFSPKPEVDLEVSAKLDLPELKQADMSYVKLPAGLVLPASALEAKIGVNKDDLRIERIHVKTKAGTLDAAGKILKASSPKPEVDLEVSAKLDLPALKQADMPYVIFPVGLALPAAAVDAKVAVAGDDLKIERLHVKMKGGTLEVSGKVLKATSAKPEADLEVLAKLDLPELTQADLPYAKLPSGLVVPAAAVEAKVGVRKDDLMIDRIFVKTKAGTLEASGRS